ncbi:MAG: SusD/RagB family nutrient-binding outer membrane lipoprotein [Bacteroidales bacterium]|nr:SusD/RagB family nutrient-binding outer membrane lipoprotein [Bacteroidales bacterium]HOO66299.1 SusD/RagB family nutrient-binding outer membrane lipoprotein [Bacteroidales bacterium]HPE22362.1 SusD/RagB family nutrient-binding outer membrane lipoprotein [Bacteroidales bacterium]HPJ05191.1 SusD/RagB family nutrient-binding outer membrane lipoprotein [Bacteroidales bacterium]HPQ63694.1 SusD/RagB family nutrient-binding outer membrane lipoprotein [Bacteroidales bacterium]
MIKKTSISVLLLASFMFMTTSCEDWLDVNKNVDAPDYVEGYLYLAGIIQQYQGMYWDIRATGPLTQMMGTSSYTTFATNYYSAGSDAAGEQWRVVYWLQGMNLENMINQSVEAENWTLAGIGYAIKAYSWDQLTKYHGELILKDAFVPGLLSHRYDYQDTIYKAVRDWAYKAIEYLEMPDATGYGTKISANDYIYGGDRDKWIKFAYGVIVRNLASLSNKTDFTTEYAQELISAASKSFTSSADDATVKVAGGGADAPQSSYNNFWGTRRGNLSRVYWQHEYAVQVFTGTVPDYDEETGNKLPTPEGSDTPYQLAATQIICDTNVMVAGHYDPRVAVKLATIDDANYEYIDKIDSIKRRKYYGGSFTGTSGPIGSAPSFYGRNASSSTTLDGSGRWLYRDDAPYILMTYAELRFCLAETYWKLGMKPEALQAFKEGVAGDLEFTATYIEPGSKGEAAGGDKITTSVFNAAAADYIAGPYVNGLDINDFTLSHIMMQKWVALYPWGASEAWVDLRKYHYDIDYTGEYPSNGNGWTISTLDQKWDTDETKVYKGFYLAPAQVQNRRGSYNTFNDGSPCYRIRPRYNSEYMWNKPSLEGLKPISGMANNYQCSIPWFAYPGAMPLN